LLHQWITLTDRNQIREVFRKGTRKGSKALNICFKKNSLSFTRYLFCSDKTSKNAVNRNRIKRVLRALVHERDIEHPVGFDIAITGGLELNSLKFYERKKVLMNLLQNVCVK
jgi:ribonuclease P protein component